MFQVYDSINNQSIKNSNSGIDGFTNVLKTKWDNLHQESGIFRYQIDMLNERIIDNQYLIQLNPNRGTKRRMPDNISDVKQPFDDNKFNFTKVSDREVMFTVMTDNDELNKHAILINVSPINRYHSLLCPSIYKRLPQVVTLDSLMLALGMMQYIEDRLCALASVNHLHYHLLFEHRMLPVLLAKSKLIKDPLYILEDYVVPTFCFNVHQNIENAAQDIFKLLQFLLQKSIAHNILMTWGIVNGQDYIRVFVWPRKNCTGVKNFAAFNVAVCELAGWFPVYDALEFANIQRKDLKDELNKWKYEDFDELCNEVKSLF